jgi:pre-mRNA-splicing factor ATP-dependent RNA helicase DHX15/PRP43
VFAPADCRKIIVSTNIAETSLTIDGVVFVVDPGFVKQAQYQPERRQSTLLVVPISKAAASQRSGRAGRTRPGKCFRLYTAASFTNQLPEQTVPEIQRSDLASVVLSMLAAGVRDIIGFPLVDPPPTAQLADAVGELFHLGAIDADAQLTQQGRAIAELPLDPKYAKALVGAARFGCTAEVATLVALLAEGAQILVRPRDSQAQADAAHAQFRSGWGDHITLVNVVEAFVENGADKAWCDANFVNYRALARADSARGQLLAILRRQGIEVVSVKKAQREREEFILCALLEGMFMQVAMLNPSSGAYLFVNCPKEAVIHPSSCLRRKPEWILYASYVFTTRDYLRTVSEIKAEWLFQASQSFFAPENLSEGLVKRALISEKAKLEHKQRFTQ